jgi:hypothetical protein
MEKNLIVHSFNTEDGAEGLVLPIAEVVKECQPDAHGTQLT